MSETHNFQQKKAFFQRTELGGATCIADGDRSLPFDLSPIQLLYLTASSEVLVCLNWIVHSTRTDTNCRITPSTVLVSLQPIKS